MTDRASPAHTTPQREQKRDVKGDRKDSDKKMALTSPEKQRRSDKRRRSEKPSRSSRKGGRSSRSDVVIDIEEMPPPRKRRSERSPRRRAVQDYEYEVEEYFVKPDYSHSSK